MVELNNNLELSDILKAVSDTTRRSLLTQLCQQGPSRVTDLANFYDMSLNAVSKHIKILEKTGLLNRIKIGRSHWIEADLKQLAKIESWYADLRSIWEMRLNKLDEILNTGDKEHD